MPKTDVVFLESIHTRCAKVVELVNKKTDSDKEKLRRIFFIASDNFFHLFWEYLAERDGEVEKYECRNKFLSMRIRHASETRLFMERDVRWIDLKSKLMVQMYEVYDGFRLYLETGK
jgi:hypothetical protein